MLVTFYNAIICNLIMFGSVCLGENISKFNRGGLEETKKKEVGHVVGKHLTVIRHYEKDCKKKKKKKTNASIK